MAVRRTNGSGTLFKRNGWYYYKVMREGKITVKSLHTKDHTEALKALDDFSIGSDMDPKARLAALVEMLKPESANPSISDAWNIYTKHPKNISKSDIDTSDDHSKFTVFNWWLYGYHKENGRINMKAAHPECKRLDDITQEIASEFVTYLKSNRSNTTTNRFIRILKRIWIFNNMEFNPWNAFAKLPEIHNKRRSLTDKEIALLIKKAEGELKILFALGPYTGLRMSDCAKLKWSEVNMSTKIISTRPGKTKLSSGIIVQIPITDKLFSILKSAYTKRGNNEAIMPKLSKTPRWKLTDIVQKHFSDCGLAETVKLDGYMKKCPVVGFHSFRITFVTKAAEAGMPFPMVAAIVGHVDEEITRIYYRANTEQMRKFINKI